MGLHDIFDSSALTPHGFCLLWKPGLLWSTVAADTLIGLAYYSIPLALAYFASRRRIDFGFLFWLFAAFILACGTTHFLDVWTMWHASYGLAAAVKVVTAALSLTTALLLWPMMPRLMAVPTPAELRRVNDELFQRVTERDLMVSDLDESRERFRRLYRSTPVPLSSTDEAGIITEVSDAWLDLLEYGRDDVIGRPDTAFMTPESAEHMRKIIWPSLLRDNSIVDIQADYVRRSGSVVNALISSQVERDPQGMFLRTGSVMIDITARRHAEVALTRETEERQRFQDMLHQSQKMEAVGQLTGGIAHDFNNLLTAVSANLDLISVKSADNQQVAKLIEAANKAVQRGANLTKQLLSFSRRQVLRPETFALRDRFEALRPLLVGSVGSNVEIDLSLGASLWALHADPGEFDLAIINICVNARDAMPGGGRLVIRAENTIMSTEDSQQPAGDFVRLTISDTGCGIDPALLPRVFEPFFTTKDMGKGTGLGLSQVYGFATQSGGKVVAESQPGHGTTIALSLPRSFHGAEPLAATPAKAATTDRSVLMVEDDDDVAFASANLIEDIGFTVHRVSGPGEALQKLNQGSRFDVIFSDIMMPGPMNGIDFAREVLRLYPGVPVILTTGHSQAAASAASEFLILPKPYTRQQLAGLLASA